MNPKKILKVVGIVLINAFTAILLVFIIYRAVKVHQFTPVDTHKVETISSSWDKFDYLTLKDNNFEEHVETFLGNSTVKSQLTDDQKSYLTQEMMMFFRAYSQGSYKAYRDFRTPKGISFV